MYIYLFISDIYFSMYPWSFPLINFFTIFYFIYSNSEFVRAVWFLLNCRSYICWTCLCCAWFLNLRWILFSDLNFGVFSALSFQLASSYSIRIFNHSSRIIRMRQAPCKFQIFENIIYLLFWLSYTIGACFGKCFYKSQF